MVSKSGVLEAFETRFDHLSARVVLAEVLATAGLADQARFEPADVNALVRALSAMGLDRVDGVIAALMGGETVPVRKPVAAPPEAPAPAAPPDETPPAAGVEPAEPAKKAAPAASAESPEPAKKAAPVVIQAKGAPKKK